MRNEQNAEYTIGVLDRIRSRKQERKKDRKKERKDDRTNETNADDITDTDGRRPAGRLSSYCGVIMVGT